jgi:hypothetical protein
MHPIFSRAGATKSSRIGCFVMTALADMHDRLKPYYSEIGRPPGC